MTTAGFECGSEGGSALQVEWNMALAFLLPAGREKGPPGSLHTPRISQPTRKTPSGLRFGDTWQCVTAPFTVAQISLSPQPG